jgi:DNA-binding FadR family transcriptional regulator
MAELVSSDLRDRIVKGVLHTGETLGSEAALMAEYGVSRPTLREAFRILEAESLITVRRGIGGGARVQRPDPEVAARYAGLVLEHRGATVRDVWDARQFLEPPAAAILAGRRTDADLRVLRDALATPDGTTEPAEIIRRHHDFHTLVVRLAGNETLALLIDLLGEIIGRSSWEPLDEDAAQHVSTGRETSHAHRTLVDLIEAGDGEQAEQLWRRHLRATSAFVFGRGADTPLDLL